MASSGALAEFARMPPQRKAMVFVAIGAVLMLVYWKFGLQSLDENLDAAQAQHETNLRTKQKLSDDIPKFQELRAHMAAIQLQIEKNQTALPSEAEVPAFFETLQRKVAESGVEIRKWTNQSEEAVESFVKVPVEIEITGTFMQIKRFFASLIQRDVRPAQTHEERVSEEHERIVSIENLTLSNPTVKNRETILNAKFTAVTFRQEDKPEKADKPGGAPGSRTAPAAPTKPAPAPTAPSTPAPPLPSATSPAATKAQVERAVDRSVERVDARTRDGSASKGAGAGSDRLKGGL